MYRKSVSIVAFLQALQTVNVVIFAAALVAWLVAARELPRYRGLIAAPVFYCLCVIVYYVLEYYFNPHSAVVTVFTVGSAYLRTVGGLLLLGIAAITLLEKRQGRIE